MSSNCYRSCIDMENNYNFIIIQTNNFVCNDVNLYTCTYDVRAEYFEMWKYKTSIMSL